MRTTRAREDAGGADARPRLGLGRGRRGKSIERFVEMTEGTEEGQRWCLRAKISVDDPDKAMRDPSSTASMPRTPITEPGSHLLPHVTLPLRGMRPG